MQNGKTRRRIYLINPKNPDNFWTMDSSVKAVGVKTLMPNAALATLITLTPGNLDIEYVYCDENISGIRWEEKCDLVGITGYTLHSKRIQEISRGFRKRGIPVAVGGTYATLQPEKARKDADILFTGEAEVTWPLFLSDWTNHQEKSLYE